MHATRFVESYIDAWNHCDPKGVAEHLVAEGVYRDIPERLQRTRSELITSLGDFFADHRHLYEMIGKAVTNKNCIAFQYRVSPGDDAENDGLAGSYCGAEFIILSGDAALQITDYYEIPRIERSTKPVRVLADRSQKHKYAKSGLNTTQLEEFKRRLDSVMRSDQAFLRSDLTLPRLAAEVDCSVNHLSQVINSGFGMSFFDYLNQHRIAYARKQLGKCDGNNRAILNVAFAAGFNSNSAFYAAFKKYVGQTPAQYRRAQLRKLH